MIAGVEIFADGISLRGWTPTTDVRECEGWPWAGGATVSRWV